MKSNLTLQELSSFLGEYWELIKTDGDVVDQCLALMEKYQDGFVYDLIGVLLKHRRSDSTLARIGTLAVRYDKDWAGLVKEVDMITRLHPEYEELVMHVLERIERFEKTKT